jgi:tetratricopeptide (TPR) repeat protein
MSACTKERYEEAKDGFYFLVTIAPFIGEAWLGLGFCYAQCKDLDSAFTSCMRSVELIPQNPDSYLVLSRVLVEMQEHEKAKEVSDIGIRFAEDNESEPWAEKLKEVMREAKTQIDAMAR